MHFVVGVLSDNGNGRMEFNGVNEIRVRQKERRQRVVAVSRASSSHLLHAQ